MPKDSCLDSNPGPRHMIYHDDSIRKHEAGLVLIIQSKVSWIALNWLLNLIHHG